MVNGLTYDELDGIEKFIDSLNDLEILRLREQDTAYE